MTFENRTAGVDVFCFSFAFVVAKDDSLNYLGSLVRVFDSGGTCATCVVPVCGTETRPRFDSKVKNYEFTVKLLRFE